MVYQSFLRQEYKYLVVLVDEVDNDFDHRVLFFGAAFGDHEGKGDEGVVSDALGAVLIIKYPVAVEKPVQLPITNVNDMS